MKIENEKLFLHFQFSIFNFQFIMELVNKVANSSLVTINLENYFPEEELIVFDLKDYLFMELILKEKDFRASLKEHDWAQYEGKIVVIDCTADAIIPVWAYMLVTTYVEPYAKTVFQGSSEEFYKLAYQKAIDQIDVTEYDGKKIVIKGCSNKPVPPSAYVGITEKLRPYAFSIMYGEPCSTVPIYKKRKNSQQ